MKQSELSAIAAEAKAIGAAVGKVKQAVNAQQPMKLAAVLGRTEALANRMRRQLPTEEA